MIVICLDMDDPANHGTVAEILTSILAVTYHLPF